MGPSVAQQVLLPYRPKTYSHTKNPPQALGRGSTIGQGGDTTILFTGRSPKGHQYSPFRGSDNMIPYMIGKLAQNLLHLTRGWSNMSPVGAIFVPFSAKTGTNTLHPHPPQSLNWSRARSEAPTTSFVLGTNPEGKERVKGKASRIQSNRIGFALGCVRRNAQHLGLKLLEST